MEQLPNDRQRAALIRIANALSGSTSEAEANGDRIAYALERIATFAESFVALPTVTAENNGAILKVSGGKWAIGADNDTAELPTVSGANNGQVLTVVEGVWTAAALPGEQTEQTEPAGQ